MTYIPEMIFAFVAFFILGALLNHSVRAFRDWQAKQRWLAEQRAAGKTIIERWGNGKKHYAHRGPGIRKYGKDQ